MSVPFRIIDTGVREGRANIAFDAALIDARQAGDVALVHASAGGTGLLLVQMLHAAGVRVLGTCSTAEKAKLAREAGAAEVIRYDTHLAPIFKSIGLQQAGAA